MAVYDLDGNEVDLTLNDEEKAIAGGSRSTPTPQRARASRLSSGLLGDPEFRSKVSQIENNEGIPQGLIHAVIAKESSGNPDSVSPADESGKRAWGLGQFRESTAKSIAESTGIPIWQNGRVNLDPNVQLSAMAALLRQNKESLGGDWYDAAWAYHAGPDNVRSYKSTGRYSAYEDKIDPNYKSDIIRLRSRLENQGADANEPAAKKSILDYGIPMTPEIAAWEPEKPAAPAPVPAAPTSPSAMDRVKQGLSAVRNIDLSGPGVKQLHPPVPQNVPTFDPDYQEMEKSLNMTLAPGYVERVKNIYEAATPDDRQRLMSAPGQAGAVARFIDKKYQASNNLYGSVPELQSLSGRREDVEARNRLNGMEPLAAKTMADREVRFGSRPIFGQAKSTDFNFERAAELNGRDIPEQAQPQDQSFGDRLVNAAEKNWNASPIRRGAIQGVDLLQGQAAGMHKMIADAGEMMGVPGAAAYGRAQTAARQKLGMRQNEMGQSPDKFTRAFEGAIASTISNAPGLAVGLLKGGEVVPLMMMSTQVAGDEYSNGVERGLTKSQALSRAVAFGAMEYIGEKLGFRDQIDMIKNSAGGNVQNVEKLFLKTLSEQIAGEELTTIGEWRIDKSKAIGLNPDSTAKELLDQMKDTLYQTVMQTAMLGAPGAASAVNRKLRESDARYDQPFADAFKPVRETHAARDVYDTTIRTPLGELRNDPEYREIVSNQTNIDDSGLARGKAARQILAERRASKYLGHIETNGVPYAESTDVSNTGNVVPAAGQDLETKQVTGSSGGQQNAEAKNGQEQEGQLLGGTSALNLAAYSITNPDPLNENDEPLSASDALFELEVLRDRANKGKLNTEIFAWSPIGKRLGTNVLQSFLGEIKAGRFGFIDQLANRIKETSGAQQNTETGSTDGGLQPRSQVQSLPTGEGGAGVQPSGQENRDLTQKAPVGPFSMQRGPGGIAILDGSGTPVSTHQTMADAIEAFDQLSAQSSQQEYQDELQTSAASGNETGTGQVIPGSGQQVAQGTEQGSGQEAQQKGHHGLKPEAESLLKQAEAQDALGNAVEAQRLRSLVDQVNKGEFVPEAYLDANNPDGNAGSGVSKSSGGEAGAGTSGVSGQVSSETGNAGTGGDSGSSLKERREARKQRKSAEAPIIQNRDRSNPASIQQMQSIAANPHYLKLAPGNDFASGAPVVVGGNIPAEQLGREDIAVTAKNREIPFRYAVVEASKLVASHNADGTPNPEYDSPPAEKSKAVAGNGRIAGLQKAHKQGSAFNYVQGMFDDEYRHGISPAVIGKLAKPILVRVMPEAEITRDIGDESNIGSGLEQSPLEKARNDSHRIDLGGLDFTDDGEINEQTVKQFVRTMPENEQGGLLDTDGSPNRNAYDRLKSAIFYKAYRNDELVRLFSQTADPEAKLVISALARVSPKMARLEGAGKLDISDIVAQAAIAIVNGRRKEMSMSMIAGQIDMLEDPGTAEIIALFAENPRSNKMAIEALSEAADFAYEEANNPAEDLFGERQQATREDVLARIRSRRGQKQDETLEHPRGGKPSEGNAGQEENGREGQGDAGEIQGGEQEGQGGTKALAPLKQRRAARKERKASFATPEQEQRRADLVHQLAFLRGRLTKTKTAFNRREIEKEIKQAEKELSKLPEGILTPRGAADLRGKNVAESELVKTWLQGANDVLDYEAKNPSGKTADQLWEEYASSWEISGQSAPISKAYFQKVLAYRAGLSPEEIADDLDTAEVENLVDQVRKRFGEKRATDILENAARAASRKEGAYFPLVRKAAEDLLKNREIVTPSEDDNVGVNAAGEPLFERKDGSRYRIHNGEPDFGGDLAPVEGDLFGAPTKEDQQRSEKEAVDAYAKEKARQRNATGQEVSGGLFDQDNRQADVFSEPATRIGRLTTPGATYGTSNKVFTSDAADKARELLKKKLGQLNTGLDPEMMQAGITLAGYHIEAGARSFAAYSKAMINDLGDAVRPYLRSWYEGVRYYPGIDASKMTSSADIDSGSVESLAEITQGKTNVTDLNSNSNLERDSGDAESTNRLGEEDIRHGSGRDVGATRSGIQSTEGNTRGDRGISISGHEAAASGEPSDLKIYRGAPVAEGGASGGAVSDGGGILGVSGSPIEPDTANQTAKVAQSRSEVRRDQAKQTEADKQNHSGSSLQEIRAALPTLLSGQQEDVFKAETRFSAPDGYGMLFTNGTGTGKTFTGLGIIKRFSGRGKNNILILAPNNEIIRAWVKSGRILNLEINPLDNTKDAGKGITITTYANFGANDALASRNWDLTVADEAHYLMQDASGTPTHVIQNLRAITKHPDGVYRRAEMLHQDLRDEMADLSSRIDSVSKQLSNSDTMDSMIPDLQKILADLEPKLESARSKWETAKDRVKADVAGSQNANRPRSLFLSATPFAYEPTVDWANGYLFDYNEGQPDESKEFRGYNSGQNKDRFFMTHFGYRMRYNKLTKPDAKVDSGLMQRQFNTWLKKRGSLSGRMLDVAADYDRRFILVESAIGTRIDQALEWFHDEAERVRDAGGNSNGVSELEDAIADKFDYLSRRYLLEAIKATEVIKHVKEHMALGRKVVVFHDYKKGGGFHPFKMERRSDPLFNEALDRFNAEFQDLLKIDFASMPSPIEVFKREFPDVLLFNGDVSKKQRRANVEKFQSDDSGPQVFLAQTAAAREGISLHDTTGKHQRVLLNLGQPTQPTTSIQQEGRIYRTGQVTDAIFRYLNTGTNWEKWAFATTIAQRASAAENLGMGEQARALKDAFIAAFEESDNYRAGMEGEGKGGKERDRLANEALTEWDRAKAFYYGTQKKTSKTKAQEGADYFATPEPLGLKMVEWLQLQPGDKVLEPSAGHGAIARWMPENTERTAIEPSRQLLPKLAMVFDGKIVDTNFEQHNIVNKYDGIVMNPPFGSGGKTAVEHLAKAAQHLRDGGRIVALIPSGPASDKQFSKFFHEETRIPVAPVLNTKALGPVYVGDTIKTNYSWMQEGKVTGTHGDQLLVRRAGVNGVTHVDPSWVTELVATGRREKVARQAENLFMVADIQLPSSVFERAGTSVNTHIVVLEKQEDPEKAKLIQQSNRDYSNAKDINDFFDRIEEASLPARVGKDQSSVADQVASETKPAAAKGQAEGNRYVTDAPAITYTTKSGKTLEGVIARDLSQDEAKAIDPYTWKKDGGYFIRMKHVDRPQPMFSRSQVFFSALERGIYSSKIETQPATQWRAWLQGNKAKLGIKDEEIAWTGLDDYLTLKGKERLSKADITAFLKDNGIQVGEVTRMPIEEMSDDRVREEYEKDLGGADLGLSFVPTVKEMREWLADIAEEGTHGTPKYEQWSFYGAGKNYRELLLTLPTKSEREIADNKMKAFTDRVTKRLGREGWGLESMTPGELAEYDQLNDAAMKASSVKPTTYKSAHWKESNVLAHIRFNDRTDADGNKVLFVEEIQSDWAQEGRKKGFKGEKVKGYEVSWEGRPIMVYETKEEAEAHVSRALKNDPNAPIAIKEVMAKKNAQQESGKVEEAPFVKDTKAWVSLALKRIIRYAAEGGYDKVAFVTGEQAADRFDLSNQVDSILYKKNNDGTYKLSAQVHGRGQLLGDAISEDALEDHVGKEVAQKIVNGEGRKTEVQGKYDPSMPFGKNYMNELSGIDLKVGGEGMKSFYDQIVPQVANDVLKKLGGGRLESVEIDTRSPENDSWYEELTDKDILKHPGFVITPAMRDKAMAGLPLFIRNVGGGNPTGLSLNVVDKMARVIWDKLGIAPGVNLRTVETESDLPKEILDRAAKEGALGTIEAVQHKGTIYLVADKHTSALHVEESILHESTHLGGRIFYGRDILKMYTRLYFALGREAGIRDWAKRLGFSMDSYFKTASDMVKAGTMQPTQRFSYLADEFLAHAQGSKAYQSLPRKALQLFREILGAIRNWMKSKGLIESSKLSDADLAYLLRNLHRAAQGKSSAMAGDSIFKRSGNGSEARFSRKNVLGDEPAATWTAPGATRLDNFIYKMQDKLIDTKRVEQAIKDIEDEWSPYQKEMLYHGRAAKQTEDFMTNEIKPLVKAMQEKGVSMNELETYLWNRHAQERNEQIAKINPRMEDGGSGILTEDAQDYLKSLPSDKRKDLDALAGLVDKINSGTKKILIDSGLEVPETIAAWDETYKFYVPLMRGESDISHRGNGTGSGFDIRGPASKRAMGSDKPVVDILANMLMQRERTIVRAEKNRVALALYGLAIQNENPSFWLPVNPEAIRAPKRTRNELASMGLDSSEIDGLMREPASRYIDPQSGLVASRINPALRNRDNVLAVRINGKDRFVFFNTGDPRAARMVEALKNLDADQLGSFLSAIRTVTHTFAAMNTQYNPVWGLFNIFRDTVGGWLNLTSTAIAGKEKDVLSHVGPAIVGIYADLRADRAGRPRSSGEWAKLWEDFQEHGGKTGYRDSFRTSEDRARALQRMLDPSSWADDGLGRFFSIDGRLKAPMEMVRKAASPVATPVFGWLSDFNETTENAIRLSAYKVAIDSGLSADKAAIIAKNLTVNFNKKGQLASQLGALYAFFNANAQGTARILETLNGPKGKKIIAGGLLVGVIQAFMMAAAGYDDDEPPQFTRERNFVVPVGDRYFSFPYPLGYHVIVSTGRILTEIALSGGKDAGNKVFDLMAAYMESFNPMGSGKSISEVMSPTITDPIVAIERNTDAFGRPIARLDRSELSPTPGFTRAKDTASAFGKWFAEVINTLSGGSDYRPGRASPTPDQIDYLIGQATGGVGREAMKIEQTVSSLVTGEELPPHKIPLLGRLYGDIHSQSAEANRFYQNVTKLNEHEAEIKGLAKNGGDYQTYMQKHPETQLIASANALQNGVSELRARKRLAMSKGNSKEQVKQIENQIVVFMKSLNDRMTALEAKQ